MANHLTPTQLAEITKMERQEVIARCMEMGVPIYNGKIDKSLFVAALQSSASQGGQGQAAAAA